MVREIRVEDTISSVVNLFIDLDDRLEEARMVLDKIDGQLGEPQWVGETHDKCSFIQQAIKEYFRKIRSLFDELAPIVTKLQQDAVDFKDNSDNIALIKTI